ncbi:nitrate reductase A subunit gamma [uncultured Gammaproteobacteria bacterium]
MSYLHTVLFGIYPYVAATVFLVGSLIRFDRDQYTWRSGSSQMLNGGTSFAISNNFFHIGILFLFFGHFVGLLTPAEIYHAFGLTAAVKQKVAMTAGGIAGVLCFIGLTLLILRRFNNPRVRAVSSTMDLALLVLLWAQLVLGLLSIPVSGSHPDGSVMLQLGEWAQRIVTFRAGAAEAIAGVNIIYLVHLALGMTLFVVFPFTRLVHVWSAPIWYLMRPYQIVRTRFRTL